MNRRMVVVGVIILLLVGVNVSGDIDTKDVSTVFDGNILYVGGSGPGNYTTIQGAIDDASDGDTVYVYDDSAPYYEQLEINKSIALIGENRETTIIDGNLMPGNVITIKKENCLIFNLYITGAGDRLSENDAGIEIRADNTKIIDNNIVNNPCRGIFCYYRYDSNRKNIEIESNKIYSHTGGGIDAGSTYNLNILHNTLIGDRSEKYTFGISLGESINGVVEDNYIYGHTRGFGIAWGSNFHIRHNIFDNNTHNGICGCYPVIQKRVIPVFVYLNNFTNSDFGLSVGGGLSKIYKNNFIDNNINAYFGLFIWEYLLPRFYNNYWDDGSSISPYRIDGIVVRLTYPYRQPIECFKFDYNPASEPYDIEVL